MSEIPRIRPPNANIRFRAKINKRSEVGKIMHETRDILTEHVGGSPTATQKLLIDRAVMLAVHLARMDTRALETGDMKDIQYLAWSNTFARIMKVLGVEAPEAPKTSKPFWLEDEPEPEKPPMSPEEMDRYRIKPVRYESAD